MATIIEMPKLSDTMSVGTLVKWHKKVGDLVENGDILAEVETDKATMELENFDDGTLLEIFVGEGEEVPIGSPLAAVGEPDEVVEAPTLLINEPGESKVEKKDNEPEIEITQSDPEPAIESIEAQVNEPKRPNLDSDSDRILISPLARKMAADLNLNLQNLRGSGPNGRIVKKDILSHSTETPTKKEDFVVKNSASSTSENATSGQSAPKHDKVIPVSKMRSIIAKRLLESKNTIPHFYLQKEINATPLKEARAAINSKLANKNPDSSTKLTLNDIILKACAETITLVPEINSSWSEQEIKLHGSIHLAFGVAVEDGLRKKKNRIK